MPDNPFEFLKFLFMINQRDENIERFIYRDLFLKITHDPESLPRFIESFYESKVVEKSNTGLAPLCHRAITALVLLYLSRYKLADAEQLVRIINFDEVIQGIEPIEALAGSWKAIPVLLYDQEQQVATVKLFITGILPSRPVQNYPTWTRPLLSKESLQGAENALEAAAKTKSVSGKGFYWFPLINDPQGHWQGNPPAVIEGHSLALPLALGWLELMEDQTEKIAPIELERIATGGISADGEILKVTHIDEKLKKAENLGYRLFIYPAANSHHSQHETQKIETIVAEDLLGAQAAYSMYQPGNSKTVTLFLEMLSSPDGFANNFDSVPVTWLATEHYKDRINTRLEEAIAQPNLIKKLSEKLAGFYESEHSINEKAAIARLLKPDFFLNFHSRDSFEHIFKIVTLQSMIFNHLGETTKTEYEHWEGIAKKLKDYVRRSGMIDAWAEYRNHCLVTLHNFYQFHPDLPSDINVLQDFLERRFELYRQYGVMADATLGALYGTLSQNAAFCGPEYYDIFLTYHDKAKNAFAESNDPELFKLDWLRQYHYRIFASLDAGKPKDARNALYKYLGILSTDELISLSLADNLSEWQHFAISRFLAETLDSAASRYLELLYQRPPFHPQHPYQLLALNLGRIAQRLSENEIAIEMYNQSIKLIKNSEHGFTVKAMMLMPYARLASMGHITKKDLRFAEEIASACLSLNPAHFNILKGKKGRKLLDTVFENMSRLFPFTYR